MNKPELLSPAGTLQKMHFAYAYGADAVYAGQPRYSLRVRNNEFQPEQLAQGIEFAHKNGKKFYIASNIAPHNNKVRTYIKDMEPIIEMGPDALIMSDPGLIMMVREKWPEQEIHLSVQSNAINYASVKFWAKQGLSRIILSRELSLEEIQEISELCPEVEIECFVHGALCIAYSGRCLLSGYASRRDPNQGACTNACRWGYKVHEAEESDSGDLVPVSHDSAMALSQTDIKTRVALLEDVSRPGRFLPTFENEHGTFIMNSKDLMAVRHVNELTRLGVHSLKIEGRTKSDYYVARTAQIYRWAIDNAAAGLDFNEDHEISLGNMATRGFTDGFLRRQGHEEMQNYESGQTKLARQQLVGEILERNPDTGKLLVEVKNKFAVGDTLELMTPSGNLRFTLDGMQNTNGEKRDMVPGNGYKVEIPCDFEGELTPYAMILRDIPATVESKPAVEAAP